MPSAISLDTCGRRRSPATLSNFHRGRPLRNKGQRYPADPPTVEEIIAVMHAAGDDVEAVRLRGLTVVLWRAGLRISEALALNESALDRSVIRKVVAAAAVHFTPGARTAWHTHPHGQTIFVTEGAGLCQRERGPVEVIRPGDRVFFEPGENHWHGAAPNRFMVHIAMQQNDETGSPVTWGDHVTDEQYQGAAASLRGRGAS